MTAVFKKLVRDEDGGEVLEYSIVTGLVIIGAISLITQVGAKVIARWSSLNAKL